MTIFEASSAGYKDMADSSVRITFEFEPRHAAEAVALFGPRGRAVAIAALKDGSAAVKGPEPEKPKGGQMAKLAGMWCADPDFWMWLNTERGYAGTINDPRTAAAYMRAECSIDSRADLDHDYDAFMRFDKLIRYPFMEWMKKNGIQK